MKRALPAIVLCLAACDAAREPAADEMTIVVQGDRREIEQQERALHEREEALKGEKARLDGRIAELSKGLQAAADASQRARIEEELRREQELSSQMVAKETLLAAQKTQVEVQRQGGAGADPQRLAGVASREAKVAEREAEISQREKELAAREKGLHELTEKLAQTEAQLVAQLKTAPAVQPPAPPAQGKEVPRAQQLDQRHKKVLAEIAERGILITDLPQDDQPLNAEIWAARRQGDLARAWDLVGELQKALLRLKVDQRFVEQKMERLQGARSSAKVSGPQRTEIDKLLREVTSAYSDGKYETANKGLNRIASILDAGTGAG